MRHAMGDRGVTRPMAERGHQKGSSMTPRFQRRGMLEKHHGKTTWVYWTIILLGIWLMLAPATFDYFRSPAVPAGHRSLWLDAGTRSLVLVINDLLCGVLLVLFGYRSLTVNRPVSLWIAAAVGAWLNAAPLLFWAPAPFIYLNDTLTGTLVLALTILIPGMPNMINYMAMGPDQPPGWSYNPSSWSQRSILILLGFAGWMISRYLAAFQFGFMNTLWDPFFGGQSSLVLTSKMSRSLPVSDAGLGAFAYTFEFLMGWMGASSRWRTMPWMVTLFGILVIPLGLVHIFLVSSQPVAVGHWCFFCLAAAAVMLPMIPLEVDEVIAMIQFLVRSKKRGAPFWQTFWKGGPDEDAVMDERSPAISLFPKQPAAVFKASLWGMSFPWTLAVSAVLGVWLMSASDVMGITRPLSPHAQIGGALILTISVLAMGETLRMLRFLNFPVALWLAAAPWTAGAADMRAVLGISLPVLLIFALSIPRGRILETYGSWQRFIR